MWELLFWLYLANSILIIIHEIDSAYWKEWVLYEQVFSSSQTAVRDPDKGVTGFLVFHFPVLFVLLYGLISVSHKTASAPVFSFLLSACGLFAFGIHMFFFRRGFEEFKTRISIFILVSTLILSLLQAAITFTVT